VLNAHERLSGERERFTLAHELGHLVLQCTNGLDREKACNRFAGAFLMPAEVLWAEVGKRRDALSIAELIELKRIFAVSLQMLVYRCFDLKIISEDLFKSLFREFKDKGWRDPPYAEPETFPKQPPRRFQRLCYRAVAEDVVSRSRAAELLRVSVREFDKTLDAAA
jgi:Zn-dependent peptidase ImmA (M78 family)